jgi:3-hydroxyacyl-[acyl-carrier-protein] dehydratase
MAHTSTLTVSTQHPAFDGHFPGAPLLPGVVLLDEMLRAVEDAGRGGGWSIATAKFLQPVRPGETLTFEHEPVTNGALRFTIRSAGRPVATGTLVPKHATTEADDGHQAG